MAGNCEYVREHYGVPAEIGRRVTIDGRPGVITADRGHYIGVTFDDQKPNMIMNAHPTWKIEYGELGRVRPMTASQRRYQEYLDVADCYPDGFKSFLLARSRRCKIEL